jgi:hypothetical protein
MVAGSAGRRPWLGIWCIWSKADVRESKWWNATMLTMRDDFLMVTFWFSRPELARSGIVVHEHAL